MNRELVIINNAEQYRDGGRVHIRSGFEPQIDELARHFSKTTLYSCEAIRPFEGYRLRSKVGFEPIFGPLHRSHAELVRAIPRYVRKIDAILQRHKDATFLIYLPASYIGLIAASRARKAKANYILRVTNDLIKEAVDRRPTILRRALQSLVGPLFNAFQASLIATQPAFFTGDLFLGPRENYHAIVSASLSNAEIPPFTELGRDWSSQVRIYFIGRFDVNKGIDDFIDSGLANPDKRVEYHIIGYGSEQQIRHVEGRVRGTNLKLHGFVPLGPPLFQHLRAAHILVMPSRSEYAGKTHIEAMAFGAFVIATSAGGISKFVRHGETGYVIPSCRPEAITQAISEVMKDGPLRDQVIPQAYEFARSWSVESMNQRILSEIAGEPKGSDTP